MSKESFYFPHDNNATADPKMMTLLSKCGLSGIGIYWVLVEILHQQTDGKIKYQAYKDYIAFYCHFESRGKHLLNTIEQTLIGVGLLLKEGDFVYSNRVMQNKKYREEISNSRSLAGKKSAEVRINKQVKSNQTSVEQNLTSVEQGKEKKGKENKGNESTIYNHPFFLDEEFKTLWHAWMDVRKKIKAPNTEKASIISLNKLESFGIDVAKKSLSISIERGWRGVFEPKQEYSKAGDIITDAQKFTIESMKRLNERIKDES